jgi:Sec-independent protein translocase protein TatA
MLIIGAVALIAFGPDQLPKVARKAGQVIRDVQNTSQSFIREMERAADEPRGEGPWTPPAPTPAHATDVRVRARTTEGRTGLTPGRRQMLKRPRSSLTRVSTSWRTCACRRSF